MSEEKDLLESELNIDDTGLEELETLVDFEDLGDLSDLDDKDFFEGLGDVSDLGDIPDLSDIPDIDDMDISDIPEVNDVTEPENLPDIGEVSGLEDIPDLGGLSDIENVSIPDVMPEESVAATPEGSDVAGETIAATPEASLGGGSEMLSEEEIAALFAGANADSDMVQEEPFVIPEETETSEEPVVISEEEKMLTNLMEDDSSGVSDLGEGLFASDLEADGGFAVPEMTEETMVMPEDTMVMPEETMAMSEDMMVMPEESATLDDNPFADIGITEDGLLSDIDIDFDTPIEDSSAEEGEIDSMLDGLLNDLDMNGSIEEPVATENPVTAEEPFAMPEAAEEEPDDAISELLGLDDSSFEEGAAGDESMMDGLDMINVEGLVPEEEKEKKPGFFKRIFGNVITDEIAEEERLAAEKAAEEAAQNAEEAEKLKAEKEEQKEQKKAEKAAKAAEKKKVKEEKKAEKERLKAEKKAKEEEEYEAELEIIGKLNKVGVSIIVIATVLFLAIEITGTNIYSYMSAKKEAENYFEMGKYTEAYKAAIGTNMRNKDPEEYNKIKTVMKVQQCLNAYQNYQRMKYYPEALDALLRGLKRYDANLSTATELEVDDDLMACRNKLLSALETEFNMSEQDAYRYLAMEKEEYQDAVVKAGAKKIK